MSAAVLSFIDIAPDHPFPLQNLPYGVFRRANEATPRIGVAIGDFVVDLGALEAVGCFDHPLLQAERPFAASTLNRFMALGPEVWHAARTRLQQLLHRDEPLLRDDADLRERVFHRHDEVVMLLPAEVGDYTDFYASREHAMNVGTMFRGAANALHPNWLHLPIGYHGRASSVVVSGTPIRRPTGQVLVDDAPRYQPSQQLDIELELGAFIGGGNTLGRPIPIDQAGRHLFGFVLVNDWSARDIQRWEYVPLGPFLGKSFATTISPWIVPAAALSPYRVAGPMQDPPPLPYLTPAEPRAYDIQLEVALRPVGQREEVILSRSNARHLYWSFEQFIAHHTSNGCNLRPGDLLASGTISGPTSESTGSLLERTWNGERPLTLPDGTSLTFLRDGDEVILRGWAEGDGVRIGFGEARGLVQAA